MKGTSERNPKPALRNYQLVSLGSNNNVQSIIESMNSGSEQGSASKQLLRSPLPKGTDLKHNKPGAESRIREKSHKSPSGGVLQSISGDENHSSAATLKAEDSVLVIPVAPSRKKDLTKASVAEFVEEVRCDRVGSSELHGTDECLSRVHNGNVMASVGDAGNSGGSGNRHKVEKNAKGQGQRQRQSSSSDNNEDDDDSETMSSAEESSEELESSSSSSDEEKVNGGGLDPISEEKSLRIDLPDGGGGGGGSKRMNRDKIIERLDVMEVEDVDEDDDDDGKLKTFNRFSKSQ